MATLPAGAARAVPLPPARMAESASLATDPPLPPARPAEQGPPAPPRPTPPPENKPVLPTLADELVCARLFGAGKVVARPVAPVSGPGGCGIPAPVEVSAVVVAPGRRIPVSGAPVVNCAMAEAFADWVALDLVPAFDRAGSPLARLVDASGYACRGRDHVAGARLSEHGLGGAVDLGGFALGNGTVIAVRDASPLLGEVRSTACGRFTTVLGPGSDGFHATHLHVDLLQRRNGFRICQWTLPAPSSLPRPETGHRGPV